MASYVNGKYYDDNGVEFDPASLFGGGGQSSAQAQPSSAPQQQNGGIDSNLFQVVQSGIRSNDLSAQGKSIQNLLNSGYGKQQILQAIQVISGDTGFDEANFQYLLDQAGSSSKISQPTASTSAPTSASPPPIPTQPPSSQIQQQLDAVIKSLSNNGTPDSIKGNQIQTFLDQGVGKQQIADSIGRITGQLPTLADLDYLVGQASSMGQTNAPAASVTQNTPVTPRLDLKSLDTTVKTFLSAPENAQGFALKSLFGQGYSQDEIIESVQRLSGDKNFGASNIAYLQGKSTEPAPMPKAPTGDTTGRSIPSDQAIRDRLNEINAMVGLTQAQKDRISIQEGIRFGVTAADIDRILGREPGATNNNVLQTTGKSIDQISTDLGFYTPPKPSGLLYNREGPQKNEIDQLFNSVMGGGNQVAKEDLLTSGWTSQLGNLTSQTAPNAQPVERTQATPRESVSVTADKASQAASLKQSIGDLFRSVVQPAPGVAQPSALTNGLGGLFGNSFAETQDTNQTEL